MIDRDGTIIYSPRIPQVTLDSQYLATHRSLWNRLARVRAAAGKGPPEIVAAGEFHIFNSHLRFFSSRAGTFHGQTEHFLYGKKERWPRADYILSRAPASSMPGRITKNPQGKFRSLPR